MLRGRTLLILVALPVVGVGGIAALVFALWFIGSAWFGLTPKVFGFGEAPDQPIAFPHTVHAGTEDGQAGIDCLFCHRNVTQGAAATVPAVEQCMICHEVIKTGIPEFEEVRTAFLAGEAQPILWERVHRLPDHVRFVHEAHITFFTQPDNFELLTQRTNITLMGQTTASAVCSTCHGNVAAMAKVEQVRSLKMGDCVDCHREWGAPTDCATCHY